MRALRFIAFVFASIIGWIFFVIGLLFVVIGFLSSVFLTVMVAGTVIFLVAFVFDQMGVSPFGEIPFKWVWRPFIGAVVGAFSMLIGGELAKICIEISDKCDAVKRPAPIWASFDPNAPQDEAERLLWAEQDRRYEETQQALREEAAREKRQWNKIIGKK